MNDPIARFQELYAQAQESEPALPEAVCLATADARGRPSARMVLLKGVDASGFTFYTNLESRKARELGANPFAALCFHWKSLGRQVRVEGRVERVSDAEADRYFASRPRGSQIGAHASRQSEPMASRAALEARFAELDGEFAGKPVPRPASWSGFRLVPERIELWEHRDSRLHHRELFERDGEGWKRSLLQP